MSREYVDTLKPYADLLDEAKKAITQFLLTCVIVRTPHQNCPGVPVDLSDCRYWGKACVPNTLPEIWGYRYGESVSRWLRSGESLTLWERENEGDWFAVHQSDSSICGVHGYQQEGVFLTRAQFDELRRTTTTTTPTPSPTSEAAIEPDGLFGVDGFRFGGVEVRFKKATLQYKLMQSLWDADTHKPTPPRPLQDVIDEVWGEDSRVNDDTVRKLIGKVQRRLQTDNCPIGIAYGNGLVQLAKVP